MPVTFHLPCELERRLRQQFPDLDQEAKEAFASEGYRAGRLSIGQVADILDASIYEAEGLLKGRGIVLEPSAAETRADLESLRELLEP